ncbi:MAG: glycoside hydrolase [Candidatus Magnetominusculus sp. LBB02]|nr:glycoside hydrolase [Candidatus Magnetominusculus sp. LBB02]
MGTVASSSDGTKLIAAGYGYIYTSSDSGATWTQRTSVGYNFWQSVASSSDGTKLVAAALNDRLSDYIYTSSDSGATWTQRTSAGSNYWSSVASSSDGTKLIAVDYYYGDIYTSSDSGATWTKRTRIGTNSSTNMGYKVASSSDGTKLIAADYYGYIYTSSDSGVTWTKQTSAGSHNWYSVASSSDGTYLIAAGYGDYIYISNDSGATWGAQTGLGVQNWLSVASSSDASKVVAVVSNGYIYTGVDYSPTASSAFNAIYSQYASWFGSTNGSIQTGTSWISYYQLYTNGAYIIAGTDGSMYVYYGGQLYSLGMNWQSLGKAATAISTIYSQYASFFGTKSGGVGTATSGGSTYYYQWFTNGSAIVAWTDGKLYSYVNGTTYSLGVSWQ